MDDMNDLEMMTLAEVAEYLSVSISTVRRLIKQSPNPLPHIKLNTHFIRVPRQKLNQWIIDSMEE
ncbi:helix-turn-helix domain-containing protein [bacterium]|nr:helix-turn-helix domain-containing protein [bacterium]